MSHFTPEHWNTFAKRIRESKVSLKHRMILTNFLVEIFNEDNPRFDATFFVERALPDYVEQELKKLEKS